MADGEAAPATGPDSMADPGKERTEEAGGAEFEWVEKQRGACEPERHWRYRREFLMRNAEAVPLAPEGEDGRESAALRRLVSFSMVWANHVFLGCRYPPQVMEKVMDMAAGITVTNAPSHTLRDELVAKVKRRISSSNEGLEEPCKKRAVGLDRIPEASDSSKKTAKTEVFLKKDVEPVKNPIKEATDNPGKILASSVVQKVAPAASSPAAQRVAPATSSPVAQKVAPTAALPVVQKAVPAVSSPVSQKVAPAESSAGVRIEGIAANYETAATAKHKSVVASSLPGSKSKMNYCSAKPSETKSENVSLPEKKVSSEGTAVLASKSTSHTGVPPPKVPCKLLTNEDAKERQPFFNRLYKAVAWKLVAAGGFSASVNHVELLNSSIQSVKATLDVEFVPLKELADLPQNKSSQENVVCELRCKSVYLGTGCGKSKENAKAVASREALKLFLKKKVVVKLCKRKYKGKEIEDLVLLDEEAKPLNLPPALRNPQEIIAKQ
uniref:CDKN2A-interacting protein n=1 Tax=Pogona vitticeps TaxID=103695 RepID=A0A6J0UD39_9SAUR